MITARSKRAIAGGRRWLCELELSTEHPESLLYRILGISASRIIGASRPNMGHSQLKRLVREFDVSVQLKSYTGDPLLALLVYASVRIRLIESMSLAQLALLYVKAISTSSDPADARLAFAYQLLRYCSQPVLKVKAKAKGGIFGTVTSIVTATRDEIIETCNYVAAITDWGRCQIRFGDLPTVMSCLAVSFARDWDINATCALVRCCAYLRVHHSDACLWAVDWLLDQQQDDGRFGLLAPEASSLKTEPDDWRLYLRSTVEALWTLAELDQPGFLIRGRLTLGPDGSHKRAASANRR